MTKSHSLTKSTIKVYEILYWRQNTYIVRAFALWRVKRIFTLLPYCLWKIKTFCAKFALKTLPCVLSYLRWITVTNVLISLVLLQFAHLYIMKYCLIKKCIVLLSQKQSNEKYEKSTWIKAHIQKLIHNLYISIL